MNCPNDKKINNYLEGELNPIEMSVVKDHLILCPDCNRTYQEFKSLEESLLQPLLEPVPPKIEKVVMRRLKTDFSYYSSVSALVMASFLFIVTAFYVIFDFANNSLIRSFENISSQSSGIVSHVIKFISSTFKLLYSILSSCNIFIKTVFNINTGVEFLGISSVFISLVLIFVLYAKVNKRKQSNE